MYGDFKWDWLEVGGEREVLVGSGGRVLGGCIREGLVLVGWGYFVLSFWIK